MESTALDYLHPNLPPNLRLASIPIIEATVESLKGFGTLIDSPDYPIEIVTWPATGTRPIDAGTGNEAGLREGIFASFWQGDILFGTNEAVKGEYILGYAIDPALAVTTHTNPPDKIRLWHANYHPDGGQLFFPIDRRPFLVPLALPGDNITPDKFVCFYFDGTQGLYIHPNVWHEGVFAIYGHQRFLDKQGAVHARVSVHFPDEFNCLLEIDLAKI